MLDPDVDVDVDFGVDITLPEREEIMGAIRLLYKGMAPGQNCLNEELFYADPKIAAKLSQLL